MKRKWIYVVVLLTIFIPPYTQIPLNLQENPQGIPSIITEVLSNPIIYQFNYLFIIAKILLLMLFIGPIFFKNKYTRIYSIKISALLLFVAIFQSMSKETSLGFAVLIGNIISQLMVVILFIWELKKPRNDFTTFKITPVNIITLLLGFFAFWMPVKNGMMYFSIKDLFMNEAGLTYCMITPIVISSLLLYYKTINLTLLKILSFIGIYYGLLNMMTWFIFNHVYWWEGIVHLPLLINSTVGFIIALKESKNKGQVNVQRC